VIDLLVLHLKTSERLLLKYLKKGLMKQYVGMVMIAKELTLFWIYHHFLSFNW